jgi:hypothetical protein
VAAFTLAAVAAEFSIVFNDSMLLRIVPKAEIGRVSNLAWGLGYLGGMIVLIFIIAFLAASPETGKTLIGIDPLFGLDPVQGRGRPCVGTDFRPLVRRLHPADVPVHTRCWRAPGAKGAVRDGLKPSSNPRSAKCGNAPVFSAFWSPA